MMHTSMLFGRASHHNGGQVENVFTCPAGQVPKMTNVLPCKYRNLKAIPIIIFSLYVVAGSSLVVGKTADNPIVLDSGHNSPTSSRVSLCQLSTFP